ncbi:hypothetical protein [Marinimicrobium locisalis]|uniref:hypothetical protein n=1 Tax=Marinimicrobium locisalis TaxID=546022 RepID=UPI003221A025
MTEWRSGLSRIGLAIGVIAVIFLFAGAANAQEILKDKDENTDVYVSTNSVEAVKGLAEKGEDNTAYQWASNIGSVADPDSYTQMVDNVKAVTDQEAISEAWTEVVADAKHTFGIEEKYLSAEEYEQQNPMASGGLMNMLEAPGRQPTKEELVLLEGIRTLKARMDGAEDKTMYGSIDWDQVVEHAWDLDNGGPRAALEALNDQIDAEKLNDLGNIRLLRKQVNDLNALARDFDATVGMAENIATMGSAVHRVGLVLAEAAGESKAVRNAKDLIEEARRWNVEENASPSNLSYQFLQEKINTLNIKTEKNKAVFYSGRGAREAAENFAEKNNLTTLEKTEGGGWLDDLRLFEGTVDDVDGDKARTLWGKISNNYAKSAQGEVLSVVNNPNPSGVFLTEELPTLLDNDNVDRVIIKSLKGNEVVLDGGLGLKEAIELIKRIDD